MLRMILSWLKNNIMKILLIFWLIAVLGILSDVSDKLSNLESSINSIESDVSSIESDVSSMRIQLP